MQSNLLIPVDQAREDFSSVVFHLEAWLESMRAPAGYCGPVAHWWSQSLLYAGPGLDWRYEGIIAGYLNLFERTGEEHWMAKARRAGNDLVNAQLTNGHYPASSFEINPASAGTPHEAACDVGLLLLARQLNSLGDSAWESYAGCAQRNLQAFYIARLWDSEAKFFRDSPHIHSFVPNKAATACEGLFLLAEILETGSWVEHYALPNLDQIITHQVRAGGKLDGAIAQNSIGMCRVEKYFPYYIARCVPALVAGYEWSQEMHYLEAALSAMRFVLRCRREDGSFPQVIYPGGSFNRYPQWIAAVGDILRVIQLLEPYGLDADPQPTNEWLLSGQIPTGGFRTAHGFASQVSQRQPGDLPEFRDLLPVVGWNDKAFRYLSHQLGAISNDSSWKNFAVACYETESTFRGQKMIYREDGEVIEASRDGETQYRWRKGDTWPDIAAPEFWLK